MTTPTITLTASDTNFHEDNSAAYVEQILGRLTADGVDVTPVVEGLILDGVQLDETTWEVLDFPLDWRHAIAADDAICHAKAAGYEVILP